MKPAPKRKVLTLKRHKPWAERYQTATAGVAVLLIIVAIIASIGWRDGYWSSSSAASQPPASKGKAK